MPAELLEVSGLSKCYPLPGGGSHQAAENVTFTVPAGGSIGIVGESGSGKTTVARMLVGLVRQDTGTVKVEGRLRDPRTPRRREARLSRAREIQMVFQDPYLSLDPRLTSAQCLRTALTLHGRDETQASALLDQVGLGTREAAARPRELSGGQRQRLAIARALAVDPRVLVLDEAVAALDVSIQAQILQLLAEIRRDTGVALVFVSHDLAVVQHITDEVVVMCRGRAVEQGPTPQVLTSPEAPYTRRLLASVPREGWNPKDVLSGPEGARGTARASTTHPQKETHSHR
ncbi:ABC transporter ATP-binding protein [Streptomyces sp. NPDC050658]|uniref:ABC transporter ATP-binding protein n=1 Tax=unclassified Streptomyces TaxID=2593676 RepID=UPI0034276D18